MTAARRDPCRWSARAVLRPRVGAAFTQCTALMAGESTWVGIARGCCCSRCRGGVGRVRLVTSVIDPRKVRYDSSCSRRWPRCSSPRCAAPRPSVIGRSCRRSCTASCAPRTSCCSRSPAATIPSCATRSSASRSAPALGVGILVGASFSTGGPGAVWSLAVSSTSADRRSSDRRAGASSPDTSPSVTT